MYFWYIFRYACKLFGAFLLDLTCGAMFKLREICINYQRSKTRICEVTGLSLSYLTEFEMEINFLSPNLMLSSGWPRNHRLSADSISRENNCVFQVTFNPRVNVFNLSTVHVSNIKYHLKLKQHENRRRFQAYTLPSAATGSANAKLMARWCVSAVPWTIFAESSVLSYSLMTVYWTARLFV